MLTREQIAARAALEIQDGESVYLDEGLARLVADHLPEGVAIVQPTNAGEPVEIAFVNANELTPLGEFSGSALTHPATRVIVLLEQHQAKDGAPAIRKHCLDPVAGIAHQVITGLAVFDVAGPGLIMREVAPGISAQDVQLQCDAPLLASDDLKVMHV